PVMFNFFGDAGEAFWVPYHSVHGRSWNLLFEAKPGSPMDVFQGAKSGEEVLRLAKQVIERLMPWDHAWVRDLTLADDLGWLVGAPAPAGAWRGVAAAPPRPPAGGGGGGGRGGGGAAAGPLPFAPPPPPGGARTPPRAAAPPPPGGGGAARGAPAGGGGGGY